jgi:rubrerythrin
MIMPSFANPFQGNISRKLTKAELIQAVRLDIAGELEAIFLYDAHVQATDDPVAQKIIADIRDEEKAHVGELMSLLRILDPVEAEHFAAGEAEVRDLLEEIGGAPLPDHSREGAAFSPPKTVGSLMQEKKNQ